MGNIVSATLKDIDEIAELYDVLNDYLEMNTNYSGWIKGVYPVREVAEDALNENSLFVYKDNDKILGSIILNHHQEEAYFECEWGVEANDDQVIVVHTLVVHPQYMKRGVSSKMLEFAKDYAKLNNIKTIRLDVAVQNEPAISLYEKLGFKYVATVDLGLNYEHLKLFRLYELII